MDIFELLIKIPIGYILGWIYEFTQNYGVALILFTLTIKIILLPLGLKQQKSMTKMQKLQPKLAALQEKYKNDQAKLSQETMKLYKEYGASPMGGCLPLLIQLPILFGLYRVIYQPITYMLHVDGSTSAIMALFNSGEGIEGIVTGKVFDLTHIDHYSQMAQIHIAEITGAINFNFLGLNLAETPSFAAWATLAIPALAGITTYLSTKVSTLMSSKKKKEPEEEKKPTRILSPEQKTPKNGADAQQVAKPMTVIMPFFTMWITYTLPMALGVYWIASNVFSMGQTVLLNGYYSKKLEVEMSELDKERAQAKADKQKNKRRGK